MTEQPGTHLESIGEVLGIGVEDVDIAPEEPIVWESRANWFQSRIRAVGGRVYLTERHLIFVPSELETRYAGQGLIAPLADLERAFVKGPMKMIRVVSQAGTEEKFVIPRRQESAERIDRAIQAAR